MKQSIWVLSERTNVTRRLAEEPPYGRSVTRFWTFDTFEQAKHEMYKLINLHATEDNELFDGHGHLHGLEEYIEEQLADNDGEEFRSIPFLHERYQAFRRCAVAFRDVLWPFFTGECASVGNRLTEDYWTNHKEEWEVKTDEDGETVFFFADTECDQLPSVFMNCFKMEHPEKSYCCRIRVPSESIFDEDESFFVNIDLLCCGLNETPEEEYRNLCGEK